MATLDIQRLLAPPTTFVANTLYIVRGTRTGFFDLYIVGTDATDVRYQQGIDEDRINEIIDSRLASFATSLVYDDIAQRDADMVNMTSDRMVFVRDAQADTTVDTKLDANGDPVPSAAFYLYKHNTTEYIKLVDWNDIDLVLKWDAIQNRPVSTVTQIDEAVAKMHTHPNPTVLDNLGDSSDMLTYKGVVLNTVQLTTSEW